MKLLPASDSSLLVQFGDVIAPELHERVVALFRSLLTDRDPRIRNLHPAYASLLIDFDPLHMTHDELSAQVRRLCDMDPRTSGIAERLITIPVCYDPEFGLDLADVAAYNNISTDEVSRLHTSATYLVYFLGFSPGFAYLGGLVEKLHIPRLATPRTRVPGGSVGIAGNQTGVYPIDSPGGWRIIGRTPLTMFDTSATPPSRLQTGDWVRFTAVPRSSFDKMVQSAQQKEK
jgi:inhibitor of KinA